MTIDVDDDGIRTHLYDRPLHVGQLELREGRVAADETAQGVDLGSPLPILDLERLNPRVDRSGLDPQRPKPLDLSCAATQMQVVSATAELEQHVDGGEDVPRCAGLVNENSRHQPAPSCD